MIHQKGESAALRLLDRAVAAHRAVRALQTDYRVTESLAERRQETVRGTIRIARPGKAWIDFRPGAGMPVGPAPGGPPAPGGGERPAPPATPPHLACDGRTLTFALTPNRAYWRIAVRPTDSAIFHTIDSPKTFDLALPLLLAGQIPYGGDYREVRGDGEETIDGVLCDRIALVSGSLAGDPTEARLAFGRADGLLRRLRTNRTDSPGGVHEIALDALQTRPTFAADAFAAKIQGLSAVTPDTGYAQSIRLGAPAPLLLADDRSGRTVDLEALRGSVVLVHFWSLFAIRSLWRLPELTALHRRLGARRDFRMVGVCLDPQARAADVARAIQRRGLAWPQIFDGMGWESGPAKVWEVTSLPASFVVGRDGRIFEIDPVGADVAAAVTAALAAPAPKRR